MIVYDGQIYERESDVPNLGSLICIGTQETKREYRGLSADFNKLPKYANLETGSSCLFLDTGEYAEYLAYNKTWYKL